MMDFLMVYAIVINAVSFFAMGIDKKRAIEGEYRISEGKLIFMAAIGGAVGLMAGMYAYSHKTQKKKFTVGVPVIIIIHIIIGMALLIYSNM
ncbi:MAG: DUF1294 domain-containing protein [Eubacteriaceae bacterium]|nr:DUF1294 domain-containing protein [Eubacteriaceae bacterium]